MVAGKSPQNTSARLAELFMIVTQLVEKLDLLSKKMDVIQEIKMTKMAEDIAKLDKQAALAGQNLDRLQKVVYGIITAVSLQLLTVITGVIVWLIKK